jgi:hypothetical protein
MTGSVFRTPEPVNGALLQPDRHPIADLRARAEAMYADSIPKRQIARALRRDPATIRRWLRPAGHLQRRKPRTPLSCELLLDAGLSWVGRFGFKPNSSTWNATRAWRAGGDAYQRHQEGWSPRRTGVWRSWPQPHDVTRRFGSWADFHQTLDREIERRRRESDPYRPRPVPADRARFGALVGYAREASKYGLIHYREFDASVEPTFIATPDGPADLRGGTTQSDIAIVGDPGTGRGGLLAGVVLLDRLRDQSPVVVVQPEDRPPIALGLPASSLLDLHEVVRLRGAAMIRSDDPEVRMAAVAAAAQASADSGCHVCIAVDGADDLVVNLARLMIYKPPTVHMAVVWTPVLSEPDVFLWVALYERAVTRITDPEVDEIFRRPVPTNLLEGIALPRRAPDSAT